MSTISRTKYAQIRAYNGRHFRGGFVGIVARGNNFLLVNDVVEVIGAMHMRNQTERRFRVDLDHEARYRFRSQASEDGAIHGSAFWSDEPDPVGDGSAPATPALLGAAVGHCLSASLLEALRHAHVDVAGCATEVVSVVAPNSDGHPRIDRIDVVIRPAVGGESTGTRRCEEVFERYCTVTASVRAGIQVNVRVDWQTPDGGGRSASFSRRNRMSALDP